MFSAIGNRPSASLLLSGAMCLVLGGCQGAPDTGAAAQAGSAASTPAPAGASPGIRPDGDTELTIDMAKIQNDELKKVFTYIDAHATNTSRTCRSGFSSRASPTPAKAFRNRPRW